MLTLLTQQKHTSAVSLNIRIHSIKAFFCEWVEIWWTRGWKCRTRGYFQPRVSVVNKDLTFKAKDLTLKAKAKDLMSEQVEGPL